MEIAFSMANMSGGGAERVVSELANFFSENGQGVSIIVTKSSNCVYPLRDQVKFIDLSNYDKGIISRVNALRNHVKDNNYDVVISFLTGTNIETLLAMSTLKTPVIISERNNPYVDPKTKTNRILRRLLYPIADGYVFQTPDAQAFFSKRIQDNSTVIMNPINPELPEPYTGERKKRIVSVGRLVPQKNHKMFIDAFFEFSKTYSDYTAEIYGEGPLKKELTEYTQSKGLENKVILRGFSNDIIADIANAAMFVLPSDYEGMSNALIEAVGMGIPCISTDHPIGGARMTIKDGVNGFLVPVGDTRTMVQKMKLIVEDMDLANNISRQGVMLKNILSITEIASEWIEYIDKVRKTKT